MKLSNDRFCAKIVDGGVHILAKPRDGSKPINVTVGLEFDPEDIWSLSVWNLILKIFGNLCSSLRTSTLASIAKRLKRAGGAGVSTVWPLCGPSRLSRGQIMARRHFVPSAVQIR